MVNHRCHFIFLKAYPDGTEENETILVLSSSQIIFPPTISCHPHHKPVRWAGITDEEIYILER